MNKETTQADNMAVISTVYESPRLKILTLHESTGDVEVVYEWNCGKWWEMKRGSIYYALTCELVWLRDEGTSDVTPGPGGLLAGRHAARKGTDR